MRKTFVLHCMIHIQPIYVSIGCKNRYKIIDDKNKKNRIRICLN